MKRFLLALCLIPVLSGCGMSDKLSDSLFGAKEDTAAAMPSCPETGLMREADQIPVFYGESAKPTADDLASTGFLGNLTGGCDFDKAGEASMEITISFAAKKGPKGVALRKQSLPYFIAVLGPDETVLQRKVFSTKVDFDNTDTASTTEEHDIRVPVTSKEAAGGYKVVVGFQLTPEQLGFNRENGGKNASQN